MDNSYHDTVGARNSGAAALRAGSDAHDANRAAVEAEEDVSVLQDDAEQPEQGGTCSGVGLPVDSSAHRVCTWAERQYSPTQCCRSTQ